ncbi:hypothetical protein CEE44_02650 [Candidatus Woesearchaeota archaeon B3_Woes]|nr:MAG: hypothetical protein CEE44_02650 [Candidatus Woesearchaeota archaeon B3_Woes]
MKKVFVQIVGCCRRRSLDATKLVNYFRLNKCNIVKKAQEADYIILLTCAYKQSKEDECFKLIKQLQNYGGELVILGCLPAISPTKFREKFNGKYIIPQKLEEIDIFFKDFKIKFSELPDGNKEFGLSQEENKDCLLRIGWGCISNCSYCAIPKATGTLKSKPLGVCLEEYRMLLERGYKEFNICAENVGSYGVDIKSSLQVLLEKMEGVEGKQKVYWNIHEIHPKWVIEYKSDLIKWVKKGKIKCLGCTIQSGSDRILKLMNRYDKSEDIVKTLLELKKANSNLYLSTHVLVGFPSETEEDLEDTLNVIKQIGFDMVIVYVYTLREGTAAYKLEGRIDNRVKREMLQKTLDFCKSNNITAISDEVCFLDG